MAQPMSFKQIWKHPVHLLAVGFGTGLVPKAPGTVGTLVGVAFYLILQHLTLPVYGFTVLVLFVLGIWICQVAETDLGVKDHPAIVWDEIVGYMITMFAAPEGWLWVVIGFGLFRLFDIWKPWPISWVERKTSGGLGVMLDDVIAGMMSCVILQWLAWIIYFD